MFQGELDEFANETEYYWNLLPWDVHPEYRGIGVGDLRSRNFSEHRSSVISLVLHFIAE